MISSLYGHLEISHKLPMVLNYVHENLPDAIKMYYGIKFAKLGTFYLFRKLINVKSLK